MCEVFEMSRQGYYAWRKRKPSRRQKENEMLLQEIKEIHEDSRQTYGRGFWVIPRSPLPSNTLI